MTDAGTPPEPPLETDRLRLREARDVDIDGVVEIQTDVAVRRYLGGPRPEAAVREFLTAAGVEAVTARPGSYVVADKITDDMLGVVSLNRRAADLPGHVEDSRDELELSYVFRQRAWGHGYAAEAARAALRVAAGKLPDQPVLLITQSANDASLRLAERLGFRTVTSFEQFEAEQTLAVARLGSFKGV